MVGLFVEKPSVWPAICLYRQINHVHQLHCDAGLFEPKIYARHIAGHPRGRIEYLPRGFNIQHGFTRFPATDFPAVAGFH